MKKDPYGVWEITIPPKSPGVAAIPHDSKIKVRRDSDFRRSLSIFEVLEKFGRLTFQLCLDRFPWSFLAENGLSVFLLG